MNSLSCPRCGLSHTKKNGHTHYRKQNYRCLSCGRQFVRDSQRVSGDTRALVKRLLLERLSLRGICRVAGLGLTWLLQFIAALYAQLPDALSALPTSPRGQVHLLRLEAEVAVFENPDQLDITREPNKHLSFGHGIHFCLGAPLARMEAQIAINTLLCRMPDLRLKVSTASLRWHPSMILRGLDALPVLIR
jgi:hypothetical protein